MKSSSNGAVLGIAGGFGLVWLSVILGSVAAWVTHVVWIVKALSSTAGATGGQIVLGVIGTIFPPVGVIHGIVIWFT